MEEAPLILVKRKAPDNRAKRPGLQFFMDNNEDISTTSSSSKQYYNTTTTSPTAAYPYGQANPGFGFEFVTRWVPEILIKVARAHKIPPESPKSSQVLYMLGGITVGPAYRFNQWQEQNCRDTLSSLHPMEAASRVRDSGTSQSDQITCSVNASPLLQSSERAAAALGRLPCPPILLAHKIPPEFPKSSQSRIVAIDSGVSHLPPKLVELLFDVGEASPLSFLLSAVDIEEVPLILQDCFF